VPKPDTNLGPTEAASLFPDGLIRWAGHRDGGVRRPFNHSSGRPTGIQIETPLVRRLRGWAEQLVEGVHVPHSLLLVGGPGNGKTDAVEGCIDSLDEALGAEGDLVNRFASQYKVSEGELPPRKVVVDLSGFPNSKLLGSKTSLSLVQDATEGDPSQGSSAEELLLEDLGDILNQDRSGLFLCCVNRGILARVSSLAAVGAKHTETAQLLMTITQAVTSGPRSPKCWPLDEFEHLAIWPMDVESLVATGSSSDGLSVAHQIFEVALAEERWKPPCELGSRCPFCQNRKLLVRKGSLDALIQLLYFYELASGKRWTFRDLFSFIAYLLVGDYSELEIKGKRVSPCDWAAAQNRLAREGKIGSVERDRAPFLLMSRLYHHRFFPTWPTFERGDHRVAKRELFKDKYTDEGLLHAKAFFRFAARSGDLAAKASGDVQDRVRDSVGPALDPALATGNSVLISRPDETVSIHDIESRFSLSVRDGLQLVGSQIETLERDVLDRLSVADESLVEDKFPRNRTRQARLLQTTLRQFSARVVKRSLGSRRGICKDVESYNAYQAAIQNRDGLNDVRKELRRLLHDSNNRFRAGLATTFGQPVAERSRDVSLVLPKMVTVRPLMSQEGEGRPPTSLPYLLIEGHHVALTFDLFRALNEVCEGLHEASLPAEIYSLLDRVKSLVSGKVVRDPQVLSDDPVIVLGSSRDVIEYIGGRFEFSRSVE
jgi:hypothetical protein